MQKNYFDADTRQIKFEVLQSVAKHAFEETLWEHRDDIPFELIPGEQARFRCCVYKEREIIRERVRMAMGKTPVQHKSPEDGGQSKEIVHVIRAACEGCPIQRYRVTENCQKCMAKKCMHACPFGAISMTGRGAYIDQSKCKECGRCAAACPYNAIAELVRPCRRACPVDAITIDEQKIASIEPKRCISCGACVRDCPFGAISDISYMLPVIELLRSDKPVYAMIAPACEGQLGDQVTMGKLQAAVKKLGFTDVAEVAVGADAVAEHESEELMEALAAGRKMTTSCCPAFVNMIQKHFPKLMENISGTVSPMTATARYLKHVHPKAKVVFIGPCIAKKDEAVNHGIEGVDYVLTMEELLAMLYAKDIDPAACEDQMSAASIYGRRFAQAGGVTEAVLRAVEEKGEEITASCRKCDGAAECKKALTLLNHGRLPESFMEGMACEGGCICGPAAILPKNAVVQARNRMMKKNDSGVGIHEVVEKYDFDEIDMNRGR